VYTHKNHPKKNDKDQTAKHVSKVLDNQQQSIRSRNHVSPGDEKPIAESNAQLKKLVLFYFLNTISFMRVQMAQHKANTPITRILALSILSAPFNQLPNILVILEGGGMLYVK
jgi:hypothetical protein